MRRAPDGATERAHLESLAKQAAEFGIETNATRALIPPPFPIQLKHLWQWFDDLRFGCSGHLTWQDLAAWKSLTDTSCEPWELETLWLLEVELRKAMTPRASPAPPPTKEHDLG